MTQGSPEGTPSLHVWARRRTQYFIYFPLVNSYTPSRPSPKWHLLQEALSDHSFPGVVFCFKLTLLSCSRANPFTYPYVISSAYNSAWCMLGMNTVQSFLPSSICTGITSTWNPFPPCLWLLPSLYSIYLSPMLLWFFFSQCCWVHLYFFYQTTSSRPFRGWGEHHFIPCYPFQLEYGYVPLESQRGSGPGRNYGFLVPSVGPAVLSSCLEIIYYIELAVGCARIQFLKINQVLSPATDRASVAERCLILMSDWTRDIIFKFILARFSSYPPSCSFSHLYVKYCKNKHCKIWGTCPPWPLWTFKPR